MHKIDARGKVCPLPLFYTKKQIDGLKTGEELEVLRIEESGSDIKFIIKKH
ncbi:MAG: sulfurtransferase TusA family protein [Candidatus Methanoperedens sp.]|nr:sulfurtransferase TusA family protein [Candidatus Methanoperedens sp.]